MLKSLIKKQFSEMFRNYYFDPKRNRARSRGAAAGMIALFIFLMVGVMGGLFAFMSYGLVSLAAVGYGWLYFAITGGVGIIYGVIGSVFNTYSGLYLAKDNDLLLSMPIPPRMIVAARTISVYLMGLLYSAAVTVPAAVIYFIFVPQTVMSVVGALLSVVIVSVIDFILACLLGWVVAKIASKLKRRSFAVVILSLLGIALYYFIYFKATDLIRDLVANAALYGDSIKGSAYPVYLFGRIGEGDPLAIAVFSAASAILLFLTVYVLSRTFIKIATSSQNAGAVKGKTKNIGEKSVFGTLLSKEYSRFKSSPTYMLNGALGTVFLPVIGVAALIKGADIALILNSMFTAYAGMIPVVLCAIICFITSTNMVAAPSVSLEGKTLWALQSLPVSARDVMAAKLSLHVILTTPAAVVCSLLCSVGLRVGFAEGAALAAFVAVYSVMTGAFGLVIGVKKPLLDWTREIVPIKQNMSLMLALLFGMAAAVIPPVIYFAALSGAVPAALYLAAWCVLYALLSVVFIRWILTKGAQIFSKL